MKYHSQYHNQELFELQESLSALSKSNRWVKLADNLPWDKIEQEYNKRLKNRHHGAGNKPARMVVGALIVKHVENLSDERPSLPFWRIPTCNTRIVMLTVITTHLDDLPRMKTTATLRTRRGPSARGTRWRPHSEPPKGFTGKTTSGRNLTTRPTHG